MAPFAYLFLLAGAFLIRQTVVGRSKEIPGDARDAATALLSANWSELGSVLGRRGENVSSGSLASSSGGSEPGETPSTGLVGGLVGSVSGDLYAGEVVKLGKSARGYQTGGTGPSYYDCSGLLWKAAYTLGIYKGNRFTTTTFPSSVASQFTTKVDSPAVGDIVLWEGHHMGVCTGEDQMFSARSPEKGINYSSISGDASYFGTQPTYWHIR